MVANVQLLDGAFSSCPIMTQLILSLPSAGFVVSVLVVGPHVYPATSPAVCPYSFARRIVKLPLTGGAIAKSRDAQCAR